VELKNIINLNNKPALKGGDQQVHNPANILSYAKRVLTGMLTVFFFIKHISILSVL